MRPPKGTPPRQRNTPRKGTLPARHIDARLRDIRERIAARKHARSRARRKRAAVVATILLALLLLLLLRCSCDRTAPPAAPTPSLSPTAKASPTVTPPRKSLAPVRKKERPDFVPGSDPVEPWFEEFRTQVSARSRRVAACFPETARGALRWSADVRAKGGAVTRSAFEPLEGLETLTDAQTDCVLEALASMPYMLTSFQRESARVSIVVSF